MTPLVQLGGTLLGVLAVLAIGWGGMYGIGKLIEHLYEGKRRR